MENQRKITDLIHQPPILGVSWQNQPSCSAVTGVTTIPFQFLMLATNKKHEGETASQQNEQVKYHKSVNSFSCSAEMYFFEFSIFSEAIIHIIFCRSIDRQR